MSGPSDKPLATSADGAGMAQASTDEKKPGDAVKQEGEQQDISDEKPLRNWATFPR